MTDDLPTPPLPDATAITWVSESGRANGISLAGCPPRKVCWSSWRCSSLITSSVTSTDADALDRRHRVGDVAGQGVLHRAAGHGQQHGDADPAVVTDRDVVDHADLGDRSPDLGVVDGGERSVDALERRGGHASRLRVLAARSESWPVGSAPSSSGPSVSARARSSSSASSDRSSDRTKSRVATSPIGHAAARPPRGRGTPCRRGRGRWPRGPARRRPGRGASCRFCASRISGAAYDAWVEKIRFSRMNG